MFSLDKKAPVVRFKGFEDDWEQRKLGEVAEIVGGGTPSTGISEYWGGDIDWYSPAEIGNQIYVTESQKKITEFGLQKSSAKILPVGTVLFTSRAGIGNTAILAKQGSTNQGFQSILPRENILDSYFIFSRTNELKKYGEVTGAGSTFVEVSGKQMAQMPIRIPSFDEQRKIGTFFKQLDDTIALHQRKLETFRQLKKGFLQKLFPQNQRTLPEIRFADFQAEWEQRKVGELFKVTRGQVLAATETSESITDENIYPVYSSQTKNDGLMGYYSEYLFDTAITWTTDGANAGTVSFRRGKFYSTNVNGVLLSDKGYSNKALAEIINQVAWKHVSKVGNPKLMNNVMSEITISIPNVEEQHGISVFLVQIDQTITLHQKKLEQLQLLKSGLLQKMFI